MNIKAFRLTDSYRHPCEGPRLACLGLAEPRQAETQSKDPELYRHNGFPLQFTPHLNAGRASTQGQNVVARAKFDQFLRQKGLLRTKQPGGLVNVFLQTQRHVSTQELFDIVRKKHKDVGYATVEHSWRYIVRSWKYYWPN